MASKTTVGIDIGTYEIKVVVAEMPEDRYSLPKIIGVGQAETRGLRNGYILNQADAVRSIRKAVKMAEKQSGQKIERAFVSVGGTGLSSAVSDGQIMITRADSEISYLDLEKVSADSQQKIKSDKIVNRKVIHVVPLEYRIDDKEVWGDPTGLKALKLSAKNLFITCLNSHVEALIETLSMAEIEIIDAIAAPLAAGTVTLSKTDKIAGCVLVNIGSETVSMVVYEKDIPVLVEVFPIGSNNITNDIALGLRVSLEDAEKIKVNKEKLTKNDNVPLGKLDDIITARLKDIFNLVDIKLKEINKSGLLPGGIILTGGGSGIINIEDISRAALRLPAKIASIVDETKKNNANLNLNTPSNIKVKDSTWAVAYGLCVIGFNNDLFNSNYPTATSNFVKKALKFIAHKLQKIRP